MSDSSSTPPGIATDAAHPPPATERLHRDGIRAFCEGDYAEAQRLLHQATLISPGNFEILKDLGHAHLHRGEAEQALALYRRAWEAGARHVDLAYNMALLCLDRGQAAEASRLLRTVVEQDFAVKPGRFYLGLLFPSNSAFMAECLLYLGLAARERGRPDRAVEHLQRALDLNPDLLGAHRALAECYLADRRWGLAVDKCRELLGLLPPGEERETIQITLAHALFEQGQTQEAVRELQRLLAQDPDNASARAHLRRFEERLGASLEPRRVREIDSAEVASPLFGLTRPEPHPPGRERRDLVIVGKSQAMLRALRHARLAAASNATVLIVGENGTGKELIARAIHHYSPRRDRPLIAVNCAALPETLLESELFGHERGAFTGAENQKKGRFELADGGTLFLDEVGDMSPALQVRLLRVLQEREFERVGGVETIRVDVRIIAATHRNLEEAVRQGLFRQDLFYRLNVLSITVPPLRERREDIPLLVEHLLRRAAGGRGAPRMLGPEEMQILMEYSWPGNVRELENFLERAVVMGHSGQQLVEELHRLRRRDVAARVEEAGAPAGQFVVASGLTLAEVERSYILHVLEQAGGSPRRAAEILGIDPSTLWRKMKRYRGPQAD